MSRVSITVDAHTAEAAAKLQDFFGGMSHGLEKITKIGDLASEIGKKLALLFSVGAIVQFTEKAIQAEVAMGDLAENTGMLITELNGVKKLAKETKLSFEQVDLGLGFFSDRIFQAVKVGGQSAATFRDIGVAVTDLNGRLLPTTQILEQTMDRFQGMADGPQKIAAAMDLFGRGGRQWISFLNQGADALRALKSGSPSQEDIENASAFHRTMIQLESTFQSIFRQFANEILPTLNEFTKWLKQSEKDLNATGGAASTLAEMFRGLLVAVNLLITSFKTLGEIIGNYYAFAFDSNLRQAQVAVQVYRDLQQILNSLIRTTLDLADSARTSATVLLDLSTGKFKDAIKEAKHFVGEIKQDVKDVVSSGAALANNSVNGVTSWIANTWRDAKAIGTKTIDDLKSQWSGFWSSALDLFAKGKASAGTKSLSASGGQASTSAGSANVISEEAKKLIEQIDKAHAEATKSKIALLDAEEKQLKEKVDREILNHTLAEQEKTKVTEIYAKKRQELLDKEAAARSEIAFAKLRAAREGIENSRDIDDQQKKEQLLPLLEKENRLIEEQIRNNQQKKLSGNLTPQEELQTEQQLVELEQQRVEILQRVRDLNSDNFLGTFKRGVIELRNEWGNLGKAMATSSINMVRNAVDGLAGALTNVIMGSKDAGQAFAEFGLSILTNFISTILSMILYAKIAIPILTWLGIVSGGSTVAPGMAMTGAAAAAASGIVAGFAADGGLISGPGGPTDDQVPMMLSNGEFVIPAKRVREFGSSFFEAIRSGALSARDLASGIPSGLASPATSTAGALPGLRNSSPDVNVEGHKMVFIQVRDESEMKRAIEQHAGSIIKIVKSAKAEIGIPT